MILARQAGEYASEGHRPAQARHICADRVIHTLPHRCEMPTEATPDHACRARSPAICVAPGRHARGECASAQDSTRRASHCASAHCEQLLAPSGPPGAAHGMMLDATWAGAPGGLRQQWVWPSSCAIAKPRPQREAAP